MIPLEDNDDEDDEDEDDGDDGDDEDAGDDGDNGDDGNDGDDAVLINLTWSNIPHITSCFTPPTFSVARRLFFTLILYCQIFTKRILRKHNLHQLNSWVNCARSPTISLFLQSD